MLGGFGFADERWCTQSFDGMRKSFTLVRRAWKIHCDSLTTGEFQFQTFHVMYDIYFITNCQSLLEEVEPGIALVGWAE